MAMNSSNKVISIAGRVGVVLALAVVFSGSMLAQQNYGTILGVVMDRTGAVVSQAKVKVTNVGTGVIRETTTDKDGFYRVLSLPIGDYIVAVEKQGFGKEITSPQKLEINQNLRMDMTLQVGSTSETVTIEGSAATVETVSPTMGHSLTRRPIVDLPLNGRNVLDLALLQPGVAPADNPGNGGASSANTAFSVSGGRNDSSTFLLDGGLNNNLLTNGVVYNPNPDAIQEYKILTSNFEAEYGRSGGGIVTVVTKSGTNGFHGSGFEFNRNEAYNANNYFLNSKGQARGVLRRNQYGGTVGGPIKKDKLFFFFAYQGQRQNSLNPSAVVTPLTPAEAQGDFSASKHKSSIASFLAAHPFFQPSAALAAKGIMDPTKIDPVAQAYLKAGLIPVNATTEVFDNPAKDNRDEFTGKFDWIPSERDNFNVLLGRSKSDLLNPVNLPQFPTTQTIHRDFANFAYTHTFTPNLLNEFRATAQRNNNLQAVPVGSLPKPNDLGIQITPDNATGPSRMALTGNLTAGFSNQGPTTIVDNTFSYSNILSWTRGRHTVKMGGGFSAYQDNQLFDFNIDGSFSFNTQLGAKDAHANFLLGIPTTFLQFPAAPSNIRSKTTSLFGQDEWKIFNRLTLSYGLRYEYNTPKLDTQGRTFSIVPGQRSTVFPNAPVGLVFPGDAGVPTGANFADKNDFAPRFGFAWQPFENAKTSIRGGVGVFYDILKAEDNFQFNGQAPFFSTASFGINSKTIGAGPYTYLTNPYLATGNPNPFPAGPLNHNVNISNTFGTFGAGGVFFVDPHLRTPYTYQYNLGIQHELPRKMIVEAAYVGTTSHKLTALADVNPFDPATLGSANPQRILNEAQGNLPAQTGTTPPPGFNPKVPQGSLGFLTEFRNASDANYNALQLSVRKDPAPTRWLGTTYFEVKYVYSHNIDNASGFRNDTSNVPTFSPGLFRGSSDFDLRHVITLYGGWDLPFDKGPRKLVKGWSLYPILSYRTGYPFSVTADLSTTNLAPGPSGAGDAGLAYANLVGPIQYFSSHSPQTINGSTGTYAFGPSAFSNTNVTGYGTAPRNLVRGPSRTNMDLALAKATPIYGERVKLELRFEAFNVFNHTEFRNIDTNPDDTTFGQFTSTSDPRILQLGARFTF
jgi:outer membrane receptor protein involved in Fe transport